MSVSEKDESHPSGIVGGSGASRPDPAADIPPGEPGPWFSYVGATVGAGAFGAAIAATPATLRIEGLGEVCSPGGTWALLGGLAIVPMSIAVVALRRAAASFVALGKRESVALATTILLWTVSTFVGLTLLGSLLRARTHHRALGGVAFAGCALSVAVVGALVCARAAKIVLRLARPARWGVAIILSALLGFVIAVAGVKLSHSAGPLLPPMASANLMDALAFGLSAVLASLLPNVYPRALALLGPPLAVVILVLGASSLLACLPLRDTIEEQAPLFFWPFALVASH
jgi:hypothetical protein